MIKTLRAAGLLLVIASTTASAHQGVQDPTVKTRMEAMGDIGKNTKILGTMAKEEAAFDRDAARSAARVIADHAARISELFLDPATDPKSEALPVIWQSYDDFTAQADALELAASEASQKINALEDLRPALAAIGKACTSCHQTYRQK